MYNIPILPKLYIKGIVNGKFMLQKKSDKLTLGLTIEGGLFEEIEKARMTERERIREKENFLRSLFWFLLIYMLAAPENLIKNYVTGLLIALFTLLFLSLALLLILYDLRLFVLIIRELKVLDD